MLPEKKLQEIKEELDSCKSPLFFYGRDADGLCSFLLLRKYKGDGVGVSVKGTLDEMFLRRVDEVNPDKIFILDTPKLSQDFVDNVKVPIVVIDHHKQEEKLRGVKDFNTHNFKKGDDTPASTVCYNVVNQNLWLAAVGTVADWHLTEETKEFAKENPDLLDIKIKNPGIAMFTSKIGKVGRMFDFILKGKTKDINKVISEINEIKDPREILEETTVAGRAIHKRYLEYYNEYKQLLEQAEKKATKDKLLLFTYPSSANSYSGELSNELIIKCPKKIIMVCREKEDEFVCSFRSGSINIRSKVLKVLDKVGATGGGHEKALGAIIKKKDFDEFVELFKKEL